MRNPISAYLARRAERADHDDQDPLCRHYWGDRAGMNLHAQCPVCRPKAAGPSVPDELVVPDEVPWVEAQNYVRLDVRGHDWIYITPEYRAVVPDHVPPGGESSGSDELGAISATFPRDHFDAVSPSTTGGIGVPDPEYAPSPELRTELAQSLNRCSAENGSGTPDFILAQYLADCLEAYDRAAVARGAWLQ